VKEVTLEVQSGASVALFGPNGAGKTTLLRLLSSALRPTSGNITVAGMSYRDNPLEIRRKIGVISHSSYLYDDLPCLDNLVFFGRLYRIGDPLGRAEELLDQMELGGRAQDPAGTLSRGMIQRLSIARSLVHDPEIVFLDEPFSGLDPHAASVLRSSIGLLRRRKRTVVMVTHNISLGLRLSDRWMLMHRGRLTDQGSSEDQDPDRFQEIHFRKEAVS
jgi:heme exporter protein A